MSEGASSPDEGAADGAGGRLDPNAVTPNAARFNLRDYGGYRTASGGVLAKGLLLRSGQLDETGPEDDRLLARLGVGTVVDLRSAHELADGLSGAFADYPGRVLIADNEDGLVPHALDDLFRQTDPAEIARSMAATYRRLTRSGRFRESMGLYFRALAEGEGVNLIHCFAGKDRTGLAVALFQLTAGVHRDDVFAEYLLTNDAGEERIKAGISVMRQRTSIEVSDEVLTEIMSVRAEYLENALAVIEDEAGSPTAWVSQVTGLDPSALDRMTGRYLA